METVKDFYPSRVSDKPTAIERLDPVLHAGKGSRGPLNSKQLDSYENNGYLLLDRFFNEQELKQISGGLDQMWDYVSSTESPEIIREAKSQEIRSIFAVHRNDSYFRQLSQDPRIVRIAEQLLGSEVYIHQSRINFKPGFTGKGFYWHSDFETWHVEDGMPRMRAVSCSILLTDNYAYNGSLMLIPGSHKFFITCVGETPEDHYKESLRQQEYGVPEHESMEWLVDKFGIDMPTAPAGSVLFFECNTMHGSGNNITPLPRSNVFFVYNSVENALVQPFSGQDPRPEYIATRDQMEVLSSAQRPA